MSHDTAVFGKFYRRASINLKSGMSDTPEVLLQLACDDYEDTFKVKFLFPHCWHILSRAPKFDPFIKDDSGGSTIMGSRLERPLGSKASKLALVQANMKEKRKENNSKHMETIADCMRDKKRQARQMKIIEFYKATGQTELADELTKKMIAGLLAEEEADEADDRSRRTSTDPLPSVVNLDDESVTLFDDDPFPHLSGKRRAVDTLETPNKRGPSVFETPCPATRPARRSPRRLACLAAEAAAARAATLAEAEAEAAVLQESDGEASAATVDLVEQLTAGPKDPSLSDLTEEDMEAIWRAEDAAAEALSQLQESQESVNLLASSVPNRESI